MHSVAPTEASKELFGERVRRCAQRFEAALAIASRLRDRGGAQIDPRAALVAIRAQIGLGRIEEAERALAAIPRALIRNALIDAERRQVKAILRERRATSIP